MSRRLAEIAMTAAEHMRRMRALRRAQGLKAVVTWVDENRRSVPPPSEVRLFAARALALHVMIAEKINRDPTLLSLVHRNFERWEQPARSVPGYAIRAWRKVLRLP